MEHCRAFYGLLATNLNDKYKQMLNSFSHIPLKSRLVVIRSYVQPGSFYSDATNTREPIHVLSLNATMKVFCLVSS